MDPISWYFPFEKDIIIFLQSISNSGIFGKILFYINYAFTFFGEQAFCIAFLGFFYWGYDKKIGRKLAVSLVYGTIANSLIKNLFRRARPYQAIEEINLLKDIDGYSFPSGHSTNSASLFHSIALYFRDKKYVKYLSFIIPLGVAFTRMYLGAHFFTDVVVGLLLGYLISAMFYCLLKERDYLSLPLELIIIAVSCVGLFYCTSSDYFKALGMVFGFKIAYYLDEKYIHFKNSKNIKSCIVRTALGIVGYLILNLILKGIVGLITIESLFVSNIIDLVRYFIIVTVLLGLYPALFKFDKTAE